MKRSLSVALCAALVIAAAGCGTASPAGTEEYEAQTALADTDGVTPEKAGEDTVQEQRQDASALSMSASYYFRVQSPGILIDRNGYDCAADKVAVFNGQVLPTSFEVRRDADDRTVYTAELKRDEEGASQACGDFSALTEEGTYYLYAQWLGESYPFTVGEDTAAALLKRVLKRYYLNRCGTSLTGEYAGDLAHGVCHSADAQIAGEKGARIDVSGGWHMDERADRFVVRGAQTVDHLLLAYEMAPDAFDDGSGIPESGNEVPDLLDEVRCEVEWLLKMQDPASGGVYSGAITQAEPDDNLMDAPVIVQPMNRESAVNFASALAHFSVVYRHYDGELATTALRAADRAFSWYEAAGEARSEEAFAAAAQLYRATGQGNYRRILESFFEREDFEELVMSDPALFMGTVTYLETAQPVSVKQSERLMRILTGAAEIIANLANNSVYGAPEEGYALYVPESGSSDTEALVASLLHGMEILAVCDHVSYSYEYTRLLSEHLHFLCGRNPGALDHLQGYAGDAVRSGYPGIENRPVENASLAVSLAMLVHEEWQ
ncbi:MAG: glycoside hydrolase family 9 protein [Lachnospiraceae bacterium]|nr:glycoside hydrolase family 9 protein [Lachnospiraceae bacterium]